MVSNHTSWLKKNLTIDEALECIKQFEETKQCISTNSFVKWKSFAHQVVVESSDYFYKVYEEPVNSLGPFNSLVRNLLASVYKQLGINWSIVSFRRGSSIFDFEQRQKLALASKKDITFSRLLLSFSKVLDSVEKLLELDDVLVQVKSSTLFSQVYKLKLARCCVNKFEDYALFNGQAVLLDDSDWYIVPVNAKGEVIAIDEPVSFSVNTSHGNFLFLNSLDSLSDFSGIYSGFNRLNPATHGWYLYSDNANLNDVPSLRVNNGSLSENKTLGLESTFMQKAVINESSDLKDSESSIFEYKFSVRERKEFDNMNDLEQFSEDDLLYTNNIGRKSFQWELWQCCNNLCPFCYLGTDNRHTDKERQLKSLSDLKLALKNLDFKIYNNVSLIGGEFFQGQLADPEVKESFFDLIHILAHLYNTKKIGSIWITATLTLGDQADLYKMLDTFEEEGVKPHPDYGASGLWICTSWDAQGRFLTEDRKKSWEYHMQNISSYYPWVKKNTTIIISQKLCEMYLNSEYDPKVFTGKFNTCLFYKQTGIYQPNGYESQSDVEIGKTDEDINKYLTNSKRSIEDLLGFRFYPDRRTFRKFLLKYAKEDSDTFDRLFNIQYRADELHRNFNEEESASSFVRDKHSNVESSALAESILNPNCLVKDKEHRHIITYATYSDCNDCMICDRDQILESVRKGRTE